MKKDAVLALLAGLVAANMVLILVAAIAMAVMRVDMRTKGAGLLNLVVDMGTELEASHSALAKISSAPCSEAFFLELRRQLHSSWHITDIAYRRSPTSFCSASFGEVRVQPLGPRDYTGLSGGRLWVNRSWPQAHQGGSKILLQRDQLLYVFDSTGFSRFADIPYAWELTAQSNGQQWHTSGLQGLNGAQAYNPWLPGKQFIQQCNRAVGYCATVSANGWQYLANNRLLVVLTLVVAYMAGWLVYAGLLRLQRAYRSTTARITRGLKNDHFYPLFQPIVRLDDHQIVGCEMLARFKDKAGEVYPDQFIPILAARRLSWAFTEKIIRQSLVVLGQCGNREKLSVSFNIFPQDIASGTVQRLLEIPGIKDWPGTVRVEITEDAYLDQVLAQKHLEWLQQNGIEIAIDDFGTGYSNLHNIDKLHCRFLKIDRSFVMDMEVGAVRSSIIPHIVSIADKAGLDVVAEGVENIAQAKALQEMGVKYAQGFYFGRPMRVADFCRLFD